MRSLQKRRKLPCWMFLAFALGTADAFSALRGRKRLVPATMLRQLPPERASVMPNVRTNSTDWVQQGFEQEATSSCKIENGPVRGPTRVLIYDTTLRDGTQGESVSASCDDKLKIAKRLAAFGVDYIEAGWPGSNPKDVEFFDRSKKGELSESERAKLVAFGSTRRKKMRVEEDPQIAALLASEAPTVCLVAKAHKWQVTDILRATPQENLDMILDSVRYLTEHNRNVFVDLEHFFDGYRHDAEYALLCGDAAVRGGATCLVLCDTNGGSMPWDVQDTTSRVVRAYPGVTIGVHTHNDCGMAVANSLVATKAGAGLVQGTINGIGERTGNADLCSIVPSLALHVQSSVTCSDRLFELTTVSRFVDELLNRTPSTSAPYVGASAFCHKGGLHVAAMERSPLSYQHVDPARVGNEKRILISELSGRQNILGKILEVNGMVQDASERALAILNHVKRLESRGYTFEGAEASVHLMVLHSTKGYCPPFRVLDYTVQVYDRHIDSASRILETETTGPTARATIKVRTVDADSTMGPMVHKDRLEVSDGNGPVDALARALKQALLPSHPYVEGVELVDYKVRILDPESATAASTRVMIEFRDADNETWTTVSVDRNIISASVNALVDGFEYALIEHGNSCMLCDNAF